MKRFDRVKINSPCLANHSDNVWFEAGVTGTVTGLAKDRYFYSGIRVMVKLDEPLVSHNGFDIKVQPFDTTMLEVIDGDS